VSWTVERRPSPADVALYLAGVALLAASITTIWLAMRAVMDIGGFCAEGGPYVIEHHCPEGVVGLMFVAFPGLFAGGGLMLWKGPRLGRPLSLLPMAAWPALFVSLGWNFLEYSLPTANQGLVLGWLIPGIVFVLMGLAPLYLAWISRPGAVDAQQVARMRQALAHAQQARASDAPAAPDLVAQLERLAALRDAGALSEAEFESAKQALISAARAG
jgi:hypothetical protein